MTMMHVESPQDRRSEIAEILARGYLRLVTEKREMAPQPATDDSLTETEKTAESRVISLEVFPPSRPHGRVVNAVRR